MDVLLGEDETLPRARLALICSNCRLVNGQAPPGVKRLEDVGKWRCGGCGAKKYVLFISNDASPICSRSIQATGHIWGYTFLTWLSEFFNRLTMFPRIRACKGDTDSRNWFSGEESEAKKLVASIKKQASSEAERSEKGEVNESGTRNSHTNREDAPTSQEDGHESDVTQNSSETSESMQHNEGKRGKVVEPENPRRRSTRSQASGKKKAS